MIIRKQPSFIGILLLGLLLGQLFSGIRPTRAQSSSQVWSDPTNVSNSGSALDPVIVVDSNNSLHAIWRTVKGGFQYSNSKDGVTWALSRTVLFPFVDEASLAGLSDIEPGRKFPFRLVSSSDGIINIFWITFEGDLMYARANSEQLPVPSSWVGVTRLSEAVLNFDVEVSARGQFHVAFVRTDEKAGIYYLGSPNGAQWAQAVNLYSSREVSSIKYSEANVSVSASNNRESPIVLVAWDIPALKRIFMATSVDSGFSFAERKQIKGPEDTGGYGIPSGIVLGVSGNNILMLWQVGEPVATRCSFYSQYSQDEGQTWTDPVSMLAVSSNCPSESTLLLEQDDFFMVMLKYKGANPSLRVWDGANWSSQQVQNELSSFKNPLTFDTILLGCKHETVAGTTLYLAGCDEGAGGDIWVTSRSLEPFDQWFGASPRWSYPEVLASKPKWIGNVVQQSEGGRTHIVWSESLQTESGKSNNSLYYSQFSDGQWSTPAEVIQDLVDRPAKVSMAVGNQENLYVVWAGEQGGSIVYAVGNSNRAGLSTEWSDPRGIATGTSLNASPVILVEASGRIVVAYSVPFNERRGIYLIQASGRNPEWSQPIQVFNAVEAGWDRVDEPQIALTLDGRLHVLFSRVAWDTGKTIGLYYSQSQDGGMTWSAAELVREGSILWSNISTINESTLFRFWQEARNGVVSNYYQVSMDSGTTWEDPLEFTSVLEYESPVSLVLNGNGDMHFLRIVKADTPGFVKEIGLVLEDWQWDGTQWSNQATRTLTIKGDRANFSVSGGLTADGWLNALVFADYLDFSGDIQSQIFATNRRVDVPNPAAQPFSAVLPTLQAADPQATPIVEPTVEPLQVENSSLSEIRNFAGIVLIVLILASSLFVLRRRKQGK